MHRKFDTAMRELKKALHKTPTAENLNPIISAMDKYFYEEEVMHSQLKECKSNGQNFEDVDGKGMSAAEYAIKTTNLTAIDVLVRLKLLKAHNKERRILTLIAKDMCKILEKDGDITKLDDSLEILETLISEKCVGFLDVMDYCEGLHERMWTDSW